MTSATALSANQYFKLLKSDFDDSQVCIRPPVLAKPSEIYIYKNAVNKEDWRADRYRWENYGDKLLPKQDPIIRAMYFKSFVVGLKFVKRAYTLLKNGQRDENATIVLIHYLGSLEGVEDMPHGNRKITNIENIIPFCTTAKSQLSTQKEKLDIRPKEAYRKYLASAADEQPTLQPVMAPKNYKQTLIP